MLLEQLAGASVRLAATRSRKAKVDILAEVLSDADPTEVEIVASYLAGSVRQRRTGVGWRSLQEQRVPASEATLDVQDVDSALEELGAVAGAGSQQARRRLLDDLLTSATSLEQSYLTRLITGELRQGSLAGLMVDAIAGASGVPVGLVQRAAMLTGSIPATARLALSDGAEGLTGVTITLFTPVLPMLAASAPTVTEVLRRADGPMAIDAKLDGIRIQAHKRGGEVRLYTRSLDDITGRLPEVVEVVRGIDAGSAILDGEVLALTEDGRPRLFQDSASGGFDQSVFFFDALLVDDTRLLDEPLAERLERLNQLVSPEHLVARTVTADIAEAERFTAEVLGGGHEGVVVKDLSAGYAAGRRGAAWVKVKPVHTLDLVVLGVEWGSGRRQGWLSNIHLGARDQRTGGFVMLGKTFKGMTDQMLAWQTERFQQLETHRDAYTVFVRPEQVVEIAFDGLQRSTRYPGGLALRFARVVRYCDDKTAEQADTIQHVRALADKARSTSSGDDATGGAPGVAQGGAIGEPVAQRATPRPASVVVQGFFRAEARAAHISPPV